MPTGPIQRRVAVNDVELALWEWPGAGRPIVFAHANGFHGRCWDQTIADLAGRHCYAVELRGHGRSSKPAPPYDWRSFGADLAALCRALDLRDVIGVGHSLGGHAVALAAARAPEVFDALLLIDPVFLDQEWYDGPPAPPHFAARRRNTWRSSEEMFDSFKDRLPFSRWQPAVLRDYCDYGLLPRSDADPEDQPYKLACPPAIEAAIYAASQRANVYDEIRAVTIPVQVVRAGGHSPTRTWDMLASPTIPRLASFFRQGRDLLVPEASHLLPMESPALVAELVRDLSDQTPQRA